MCTYRRCTCVFVHISDVPVAVYTSYVYLCICTYLRCRYRGAHILGFPVTVINDRLTDDAVTDDVIITQLSHYYLPVALTID